MRVVVDGAQREIRAHQAVRARRAEQSRFATGVRRVRTRAPARTDLRGSWLMPLLVCAWLLLATAEPGHPPAADRRGAAPAEPGIVFCYGERRAICQRFPRGQLALRTG